MPSLPTTLLLPRAALPVFQQSLRGGTWRFSCLALRLFAIGDNQILVQDKDDSAAGTLESSSSALTVPPECADEIFLEGPRSRFDEFITLLRVMRDFLRGFRTLHFVGPCDGFWFSANQTG